MKRARYPRVRVYELLRTAHLERAHELAPASVLYAERRYDFDEDVAQGLDLIQAGTLAAPITIARSRITDLEVHEPLVTIGVVRTLLSIHAARVAGRLRRREVRIVAYAIENRDPFARAAFPAERLRHRVRRACERVLVRRISRQVDRIAFGTEASQELYRRVLPAMGATAEVIAALPAPCSCPADLDVVPGSVLYVGSFAARKGVPQLMAAWPLVLEQLPEATLTMIGTGPLRADVLAFAQSLPGVRVIIDPPRAEIHRELRSAQALVLLSQPTALWREQVGLPIVEGLGHGCAVVTTDQTGLAGWLADHGHAVLAPDAPPEQTAAAIVADIRNNRPATDILSHLPAVDGRLAADAWLFEAHRNPERTPS
jgi:glycosyltransferase involved in cell wall biosynthesis